MAQSTMARGMAFANSSQRLCDREEFKQSSLLSVGSNCLDLIGPQCSAAGREFGNMQEQLVLYHPDSCQPMQQPRLDDHLALLLQSVFHRETNTVHAIGSSDGPISTSALTRSRFLGALYLSSECYSRPSNWWQMCASFGPVYTSVLTFRQKRVHSLDFTVHIVCSGTNHWRKAKPLNSCPRSSGRKSPPRYLLCVTLVRAMRNISVETFR